MITILVAPFITIGQASYPTYFKTVKTFFNSYAYIDSNSTEGINFAKKRDGWHVQKVDRLNEKVISDQLFYNIRKQSFIPLQNFIKIQDDKEDQTGIFLNASNLYFPAGYDHCIYYGYSQWPDDVIQDFEKSRESLPDSLLESLARAYSACSSRFSWYQYGGTFETNDSLKSRLKPMQLPSSQRLDSIRYYLDRSIQTYQLLAKKNNSYRTFIGNAGMKVFNEQMNGYMQMSMAGKDSLASNYIEQVNPNATIRTIARNYLIACPENSIIFTFGDNDTYPLWYVQEAENTRKDVAVINLNLLGLTPYLNFLKRKNIVKFSTPSSVYGDSSFLYFVKENRTGDSSIELSDFISQIQTRKYIANSDFYGPMASYFQDIIELPIDTNKFSMIAPNGFKLAGHIDIKLGSYILNSDFLVLDILYSNLYSRPIFFAADYQLLTDHFFRNGFLYRFIPAVFDYYGEHLKIVRANNEEYFNMFTPVLSYDISTGIAPSSDADGLLYGLVCSQSLHYLNSLQRDSAIITLKRLDKIFLEKLPPSLQLKSLSEQLLILGLIDKAREVSETYASLLFQSYLNYSPENIYISKKEISQELNRLYSSLQAYHVYSKKIEDLQLKLIDE